MPPPSLRGRRITANLEGHLRSDRYHLAFIDLLAVDHAIERTAQRMRKSDHLAQLEIQQVPNQDARSFQPRLHPQPGSLQQLQPPFRGSRALSRFTAGIRLVGFRLHHFDGDRRHRQVHNSRFFAHPDLRFEGNHGFRGQQHRKGLRVCFRSLHFEFDQCELLPGIAELVENQGQGLIQNISFDLRDLAADLALPADFGPQQDFQNRKHQLRVQFEDGKGGVRLDTQGEQARGPRHPAQKFRVQLLLHRQHTGIQGKTQVRRGPGVERPQKGFEQGVELPDLGRRKTIGLPKIV